jgi:HD-like signal output (HDOD) protein
VIRFVLSGHAEEEVILQASKLAHQFFPKPCNVDELRISLERSLSLNELLADSHLCSVVSSVAAMPGVPEVYTEIVEKLNSHEVTVREIGKVISRDPAISMKILQLMNSAYFSIGREVSDVVEAVGLLGVNSIKYLVLSVEMFSQFDQQKLNGTGFHLEESIDHSIRVGLLAKKISLSEHAEKRSSEESYLSGFLHDVGKLILADNFSLEYRAVVELEQSEQISLCHAEREIIGADHGAVGAYLLGLWGFSDAVLESVAFHHAPSNAGAMRFAPLTSVHVANLLDNARADEHPDSVLEGIDFEYLSALNLESRLPIWRSLGE